MFDPARVRTSLRSRKADTTLGRDFYTDPSFYEFDLESIFYRQWLFAGVEAQLRKPGDYFTLDVGPTSVIVLRNRKGDIKAFHNTCRHRGSRICLKESGRATNLVCPYHQWAYDLNGNLIRARMMPDGFDKAEHGLKPVHVEALGGTIYICLADAAPDFAHHRRSLEPLLAPHDLANAKVAHDATIIEQGNWKLVMENSRECYHCAAGHPELMNSFQDFYDLESEETKAFWEECKKRGLETGPVAGHGFTAARIPLGRGAVSITMDGRPAVAKPLGHVGGGDIGSLRWARYPNMFSHTLGDYAFFFRLLPIGPNVTAVNGKWLVPKDAVEGVDYDLERLTEVWLKTNDQDRWLVENNQRGVNSMGYQPGPYSPTGEWGVIRFIDWYCAEAEGFFSGGRGVRAVAAE